MIRQYSYHIALCGVQGIFREAVLAAVKVGVSRGTATALAVELVEKADKEAGGRPLTKEEATKVKGANCLRVHQVIFFFFFCICAIKMMSHFFAYFNEVKN